MIAQYTACQVCGREPERLVRNRCPRCYMWWWRYGVERPRDFGTYRYCARGDGRLVKARGLCHAHYAREWHRARRRAAGQPIRMPRWLRGGEFA